MNLVDLLHVAASGNRALALRDDEDVSDYKRDAIPFSLLGSRAP